MNSIQDTSRFLANVRSIQAFPSMIGDVVDTQVRFIFLIMKSKSKVFRVMSMLKSPLNMIGILVSTSYLILLYLLISCKSITLIVNCMPLYPSTSISTGCLLYQYLVIHHHIQPLQLSFVFCTTSAILHLIFLAPFITYKMLFCLISISYISIKNFHIIPKT